MYGGSTRSKKNATPSASGTCGDSGGTQTGWNIKWVDIAAGAGGGSELSDVRVLGPSQSRWCPTLKPLLQGAMYDHNQTRAKWFYMYAGAKGTLYSGILPGQDDEAVAYHSAGGVSGTRRCRLLQPW
jgi:hypothetical protein